VLKLNETTLVNTLTLSDEKKEPEHTQFITASLYPDPEYKFVTPPHGTAETVCEIYDEEAKEDAIIRSVRVSGEWGNFNIILVIRVGTIDEILSNPNKSSFHTLAPSTKDAVYPTNIEIKKGDEVSIYISRYKSTVIEKPSVVTVSLFT
jgi:hypothetical protein